MTIETIFSEGEYFLQFIKFMGDEAVTIGKKDDTRPHGRIETFNLERNERLLGFEIHHDGDSTFGVTWIKWAVE